MRKSLVLALAAALLALPVLPAAAASGTYVMVSEKIPGSKCEGPIAVTGSTSANGYRAVVWKCEVGAGFSGFFGVLRGLLKYGILIGLLFGVLMIVVAGIRIASSGAAEGLGFGDQRTDAKMMLIKVVSGIVALALVGFILNTVAPWIFAG